MPDWKMVTAYDVIHTSQYNRVRGQFVKTFDENGNHARIFPMKIFNEADQELGLVENPDEFIQLWNMDLQNQQVGRLELGVENTVFWIIGRLPSRGHILANEVSSGDFNNDFNEDFSI
jgi:hypothetical protein